MPGVVVRYAKGKGFLMDEHLAKVWVCSQLTNTLWESRREEEGIFCINTGYVPNAVPRCQCRHYNANASSSRNAVRFG